MTPNDAVPTTRIDEDESPTPREEDACPRCGGTLCGPRAPTHRAALSRTKPPTSICSACGTEEALEAFLRGRPTPQSEWPLRASAPTDY